MGYVPGDQVILHGYENVPATDAPLADDTHAKDVVHAAAAAGAGNGFEYTDPDEAIADVEHLLPDDRSRRITAKRAVRDIYSDAGVVGRADVHGAVMWAHIEDAYDPMACIAFDAFPRQEWMEQDPYAPCPNTATGYTLQFSADREHLTDRPLSRDVKPLHGPRIPQDRTHIWYESDGDYIERIDPLLEPGDGE